MTVNEHYYQVKINTAVCAGFLYLLWKKRSGRQGKDLEAGG
jgi:hypothetical protein